MHILSDLFHWSQILPGSVILYLDMEFIEIIAYTQQKGIQFYFIFPTKQKSLKFLIMFQNPEYFFCLNQMTHPPQNSCFTQNVFICSLMLL